MKKRAVCLCSPCFLLMFFSRPFQLWRVVEMRSFIPATWPSELHFVLVHVHADSASPKPPILVICVEPLRAGNSDNSCPAHSVLSLVRLAVSLLASINDIADSEDLVFRWHGFALFRLFRPLVLCPARRALVLNGARYNSFHCFLLLLFLHAPLRPGGRNARRTLFCRSLNASHSNVSR